MPDASIVEQHNYFKSSTDVLALIHCHHCHLPGRLWTSSCARRQRRLGKGSRLMEDKGMVVEEQGVLPALWVMLVRGGHMQTLHMHRELLARW